MTAEDWSFAFGDDGPAVPGDPPEALEALTALRAVSVGAPEALASPRRVAAQIERAVVAARSAGFDDHRIAVEGRLSLEMVRSITSP